MIDCCELAAQNAKLALYLGLGAFAVISFLLAMFFGYNLKLSARTASLEKKNGKELAEIEKIKKEDGTRQNQINEVKAKLEKLENKLKNPNA